MPQLKRRTLLQMIGASALAPALPALPLGAATNATPAQMLWASMHARAGSTAAFVEMARSVGVSQTAAQGIGARLAGSRILDMHGARALTRATRPAAVTKSAPSVWRKRLARIDLETALAKPEAQKSAPQESAGLPDPKTPE